MGPKKRKKKVSENNGQLCFIRHYGWSTQATWTKIQLPGYAWSGWIAKDGEEERREKEERAKVSNNKGQVNTWTIKLYKNSLALFLSLLQVVGSLCGKDVKQHIYN